MLQNRQRFIKQKYSTAALLIKGIIETEADKGEGVEKKAPTSLLGGQV